MKKNGWVKSFGLILFYLFLNIMIGAFNEVFKIDNSIILNIILSVETILIMIIIAFFLKDDLKGQLKDFKKNYKSYITKCFRYWAVGFTCMLISNLIINYFFLGGIAPNEEANREILKLYPVYSVLSMCIVGPFTEELLFRLNFKHVLKNRWAFILVTGIIFGSMHVILSFESIKDLLFIIPYSSLGIAFGACYYDTKNIYSSTLMHAFHNSLTVFIIFMGI